MTSDARPRPPEPALRHAPTLSRAARNTAVTAAVLVLGSILAVVLLDVESWGPRLGALQWWHIAITSIVTELLVFHVSYRREDYTFSLSEVTLVVGLLFVSPLQFIAGRMLGESLVFGLKERQPPRKLCLNLATRLTECVVVVGVYHALDEVAPLGDQVDRPWLWGGVLVSVLAADLVTLAVVLQVVRWHRAPMRAGTLLQTNLVIACVNTGLGLVAAIVITVQPWALLLLSGLAGFIFLSYRSYESLDQRYSSLEVLNEFTRLVGSARTADDVLAGMITHAREQLRAERAEIWLADGSGQLGLRVDERGFASITPPPDSWRLVCELFDRGAPSLLITSKGSTGCAARVAEVLAANDAIIAPLTEAGELVGMLAVVDRLGEITVFDQADAQVFAMLATHAGAALENGRLIDRLNTEARQRQHEAHHDALTGLPNRTLFGQRLVAHLADLGLGLEPAALAVGILDLDGFKEINDTLGHQWGDEVLVEIARRLSRVMDPSTTVARLGGDEFAVLVPNARGHAELERLGRKLRSAVATPLPIEDLLLEVGVSIGFAIAPRDGVDSKSLLRRADAAMYEAKSGMGGGVVIATGSVAGREDRRVPQPQVEVPATAQRDATV